MSSAAAADRPGCLLMLAVVRWSCCWMSCPKHRGMRLCSSLRRMGLCSGHAGPGSVAPGGGSSSRVSRRDKLLKFLARPCYPHASQGFDKAVTGLSVGETRKVSGGLLLHQA